MGVGKREEKEGGENEDEISHPMTSLKLQPRLFMAVLAPFAGEGKTGFRGE